LAGTLPKTFGWNYVKTVGSCKEKMIGIASTPYFPWMRRQSD